MNRLEQGLQKNNWTASSRTFLFPDLFTNSEEEQLGHAGLSSWKSSNMVTRVFFRGILIGFLLYYIDLTPIF